MFFSYARVIRVCKTRQAEKETNFLQTNNNNHKLLKTISVKNFTKLLMAVVLLATYSCVQDQTDELVPVLPEQGGSGEVATLRVTLPAPPAKTSIGEVTADGKYPVYWSEGDRLAVNGKATTKISIDENNPAVAVFELPLGITIPYNIVYPYQGDGVAVNGKNGRYPVLFATEQVYTEGTFSEGSAPMYAYSDGFSDVKMQHLATALRFSIKAKAGEEVALKYVSVSTAEAEPISGVFDLDCQTGELYSLSSSLSTVFYTFEEGSFTVTSDKESTFYITVPKGEYKQFDVNFVATDGRVSVETFDATGENAIGAGKVRVFPCVEFSEDQKMHLIGTDQDMMDFAESVKNGTFSGYDGALLVADIDMSNKEWQPIENYNGLFEGRNHTISGLTGPLFGDNAVATISNVIVEANIVETKANIVGILTRSLASGGRIFNSFAKGSITYTNSSVAASGKYTDLAIGGLVGHVKGGEIEKARAEVDIKINGATPTSSSANYYPCVGGIVGYAESNAKIVGTTNYSSIVWNDTSLSSTSHSKIKAYIGGTIGYLPAGCTFSENVSEGALTVKSSVNQLYLGGVVGLSRAEMDNCSNKGNISVAAEFARGMIGGVVGLFNEGQTQGLTLESARNEGQVIIGSSYYITDRSGIGGIVGYAYPKSDVSACSNAGEIFFSGSSKCPGPDAKTTSDNSNIAIGGVVGLDYSDKIYDCVNEKSATIDVGGSLGSTHWLDYAGRQSAVGGISGVRTEADKAASGASIKNCINYADLNLHFVQLGAIEVFMGGVVGSYIAYDMYDCHNHGDIICSVDYSDAMKTSIKTANLSGVVGFAAFKNEAIVAKIEKCSNTGKIEYKSATANTINLAGVARLADDYKLNITLKDCLNSGDVVVNNDAVAENIYVGGVLSRLGSTVAPYMKMFNCTNDGTLDCKASTSGKVCIGGVFATSAAKEWTEDSADNLYNTGNVTFSGVAGTLCIGGYAGEANGVHNVSFEATANVTCTGSVNGSAYIGGYIGNLSGLEVGGKLDVKNSGSVSFNGVANNVYLAGGIASLVASKPIAISGVTNMKDASVVFHDNKSKNLLPENVYIGGAFGYVNLAASVATRASSILNACANDGAIEYYGKCTDGAYIGGVAGFAANASLKECHNTGDIISKGIAGGISSMYDGSDLIVTRDMAVGGVVGEACYDIKKCSNSGDINYTCVVNTTIHDNVTSRFDIGGVVGRIYSEVSTEERDMEFSTLLNTGDITINGTPGNVVFPWAGTGRDSSTGAWAADTINNIARVDYRLTRRNNAGGIFGRVFENCNISTTLDLNSTFVFNDCVNEGDITAPNVGQVRVLQLGGVLADHVTCDATFTSCHNKGSLSVGNANADDAQHYGYFVYMGGILARNFNVVPVQCTTGSITTTPNLTFLNCTNEGSISLSEGKNGIRNTVAGGILAEALCGTSDFKSSTGTYRRYWNITFKGCKNLAGGDISYTSPCQNASATCTYAGGIMGKGGFGHQNATSYFSAMNLQIEDCENHASIQYDRNDGKTAWYSHPEQCGVGGIIGHFIGAVVESNKIAGINPWECVITSCRNYGRVWGLTGYIGGIIGYARHNVIVTGTETNPTVNYGDIIIKRDSEGNPILKGIYGNRAIYAGGIIGATYEYNYGSSTQLSYAREIRANNAVNEGAVGSLSYAGGIAGLYYSAEYFVENCTNKGNVYSLEGNSTQIGAIVGSPRTTPMTLDGTSFPNRPVGVRNCKVGGGVLRGALELVEVTESNYHDYIYGEKWSGGINSLVDGMPYDGCIFLSVNADSGSDSDDNSSEATL